MSADDKIGQTGFVTGTEGDLQCQFELLPQLVGEMKKGGDGFEFWGQTRQVHVFSFLFKTAQMI